MSTLFSAMSLLVAPLWLAMIFLPRARITQRLVASPLCVLPIALVYVVLVVPVLVDLFPLLMGPELSTIAALLGEERGATIAWAHFLAFDAFVGRWVFLDAQPRLDRRGLTRWLLSPILFAILMFGPLGLTAYLVLRTLDDARP
jgi:hypothetical protein